MSRAEVAIYAALALTALVVVALYAAFLLVGTGVLK